MRTPPQQLPTRRRIAERTRWCASWGATIGLASIYPLALAALVACGGDGGPAAAQSTGGANVPPALVGTWRDAAASGSQVCDELGHCSVAYGGSESYTFTAEGQFAFAQQLEANLGGCRIVTSLSARGTVAVRDARLTLTSTWAHNTKTANCESGFDEDLQLDPTRYGWRLASGADGQPQLYLTGEAGSETGPYDLVR